MKDDPKLKSVLQTFKKYLSHGGDIHEISAIAEEVNSIVKAHHRKDKVTITTAIALNEKQQEEINQVLASVTGHPVESKFMVNPKIIGGLKVQLGDHVIDMSLETTLQHMADSLNRAYQ